MKILGTVYACIGLKELAERACISDWKVISQSQFLYQLQSKGVSLFLENSDQSAESAVIQVLIYGDIDLPLKVVDEWVAKLQLSLIGCNLDVHGDDDARLVRRYAQ